jgi:hypothetical protein
VDAHGSGWGQWLALVHTVMNHFLNPLQSKLFFVSSNSLVQTQFQENTKIQVQRAANTWQELREININTVKPGVNLS